jgi:hypothetical protein
MSTDHNHLDSDQLLQAVVGKVDLPKPLRAHLKSCPHCRQEVDRLGSRFGAIGRMARELSPDALGRVRLPETHQRFFFGRRVGLRPALGMVVAMVLLMMIALYRPMGNRPMKMPVIETAELNPEAEARLFAEIQALLHNPLPDDYQQLSGDIGFEDQGDPTDFIVPEVEAETEEDLSWNTSAKGIAS